MQYSPKKMRIPYVSMVDAGTIETRAQAPE